MGMSRLVLTWLYSFWQPQRWGDGWCWRSSSWRINQKPSPAKSHHSSPPSSVEGGLQMSVGLRLVWGLKALVSFEAASSTWCSPNHHGIVIKPNRMAPGWGKSLPIIPIPWGFTLSLGTARRCLQSSLFPPFLRREWKHCGCLVSFSGLANLHVYRSTADYLCI